MFVIGLGGAITHFSSGGIPGGTPIRFPALVPVPRLGTRREPVPVPERYPSGSGLFPQSLSRSSRAVPEWFPAVPDGFRDLGGMERMAPPFSPVGDGLRGEELLDGDQHVGLSQPSLAGQP